jgi:Protein of unknown function (DUF3738)
MNKQINSAIKALCILGGLACLDIVYTAHPQDHEPFDVVSIKVSQADTNELIQTDKGIQRPAYMPFRFTPGRVTCTQPLTSIVAQAYGLKFWQVVGPAWLYDGAYEIQATMPADTSRDHALAMLRSMLTDRFELNGCGYFGTTLQASGYRRF